MSVFSGLSAIAWKEFLHVVRDPYERAVSCYRHALRTGYEDERLARNTDQDDADGGDDADADAGAGRGESR